MLAVPLDGNAATIAVQIQIEATVHAVELNQVFGLHG